MRWLSHRRITHFILTVGYVLFFMIHVIQVTIAGWNNFRSVISGFEIVAKKTVTVLKVENKDEESN